VKLPFGIDLKSVIITLLFVYLVLPFLLNMFGGRGRKASEA